MAESWYIDVTEAHDRHVVYRYIRVPVETFDTSRAAHQRVTELSKEAGLA